MVKTAITENEYKVNELNRLIRRLNIRHDKMFGKLAWDEDGDPIGHEDLNYYQKVDPELAIKGEVTLKKINKIKRVGDSVYDYTKCCGVFYRMIPHPSTENASITYCPGCGSTKNIFWEQEELNKFYNEQKEGGEG